MKTQKKSKKRIKEKLKKKESKREPEAEVANPGFGPAAGQAAPQVQTTTGETITVEFNKVDSRICSSASQINNCPAFFLKDQQSAPICRVTNRVCIYMNSDYKNCGVYNTASTSDPNIFELPFGKEATYSYLMGIKQ